MVGPSSQQLAVPDELHGAHSGFVYIHAGLHDRSVVIVEDEGAVLAAHCDQVAGYVDAAEDDVH